MKNRILLALLSLLGFATACNKGEEMYGTPRANFRIQGKVTDAAGQPIKGIEVRTISSDKNTTAADGSYDLTGDMGFISPQLVFTDIDGSDNGGEFTEQTLDIEFTEADRTAPGDGGWDRGSFAKTGVDITLQEKE